MAPRGLINTRRPLLIPPKICISEEEDTKCISEEEDSKSSWRWRVRMSDEENNFSMAVSLHWRVSE